MCHFKNLHVGHKIIEITDKDSLKQDNITIEFFSNVFNEKIQDITNLKIKIEKQIDEINKSYDIIDNQISKKFEEEHAKLIEEENNLKDKLMNEVTKTKENLEKYLSEYNQIIKNYEKVTKGIKILEKEEKNMLKILSYITQISKSNKQMEDLHNELLKTLEIYFNEKDRKVIYKRCFFNGYPIPQEIKISEISSSGFKLEWSFNENDKISKLNDDYKKFKVELREEKEEYKNKNDIFNQVYLGNQSNCYVKNLKPKTKYEIKICGIYENIEGEWSDIKNITTIEYDQPNSFIESID